MKSGCRKLKKPYRIGFVSGDITRKGGTERISSFLANALSEDSDFRIYVISLTEEETEPLYHVSKRVKRYRLLDRWPVSPGEFLSASLRLTALVKKRRIDVLVDIDSVLDIVSLPVKLLTGVRLISWEHFSYFYDLGVSYREPIRKLTALFSDLIVTLTDQDARNFRNLSYPVCPVRRIYNPADLPGMREPLEAPQREKLIMAAGRLTRQKGFADLIKSAVPALKRNPGWELVILGEGEDRERLQALIRKSGLADRIHLTGFVNDPSVYYEKASIYAMTSEGEGLPMVLLEAKYYGLPCVSYDVPFGPAEIITDGLNGVITPAGDILEMARALDRLMRDENLRLSLQEHVRDDIDRFSGESIIKTWKKVIKRVVNKPGRRVR